MFSFGVNFRHALIRTFLWVRKKWVYHSLFWLAGLCLLMFLSNDNLAFSFRLFLESINILFYMLVAYTTHLYIIPNFITEFKDKWTLKRDLAASAAVLILCCIVTPIKTLIVYSLHNGSPQIQDLVIDNQIWYFVGLVYIAGVAIVYSIVSDWRKQEREREELQSQTIESELRFLKTQINPHFLFNTLNSLYALTLKKSDKASEVVLQLSEMMRYMLYECNEQQVTLSKEVSYIENYLQLEQLRLRKDINIEFKANGIIEGIMIAPLLFIPFIENAFKHGVANQIGTGYVYITLHAERSLIRFLVTNSKANINATSLSGKKSGGIGLANVKRRLDLLYPQKNELLIEDNPDTYSVNLVIYI